VKWVTPGPKPCVVTSGLSRTWVAMGHNELVAVIIKLPRQFVKERYPVIRNVRLDDGDHGTLAAEM
jgi:hypothetical protein